MPWTVTNHVEKGRWNVLALSFVVVLVGGVCVPGRAQLNTQKDASFVGLDSSVPVANMGSPSRSASASSANQSPKGKYATGLSSLPVEDGGARYPVVVNPWVQQAELTASDGAAGDSLGWSVAVSGSTAVVGAPVHNNGIGAAYVFVESGGTWTQQAELTASDGAAGDIFGNFVAVDGSTVVVGAPFHTVGSNAYQGAAYVFVESGGTWTQQAELTASDGAAGDNLGPVAVSGGTALVGAPFHTPIGFGYQGAAYVFVESGGTWTQQAELTVYGGPNGGLFGYSVAVGGSTAVMGNPYEKVSQPGQGAAYVFVESGGTWSQQAKLTASDGGANRHFGSSVAVSGSTAVLGECQSAVTFASCSQGAAYVFVESGGTWSQQAELTPSDGADYDYFGWSVAVDSSTVVVGAICHPGSASSCGQGAAYVFAESGGTWSQQTELTASDGAAGDYFGRSVAVSGSTAVAGAPNHPVGTNAQQGAAYVLGSSASSGDFTIGASPTTVAIGSPGQSGTTAITITPSGGFNQTITFTGASCSGLPTGATCSFNPGSVTPNGGPVSTTLTFATMAASAAIPRWPLGGRQGIFFALAVPGLLILGAGGRGKRRSGVGRAMLFVLLVGFSLVSFNGCGSSGSSGGGGGGGGTPAGTYTITVAASASGLSHSTTVTLIVQ